MAVISATYMHPLTGKADLALARAKRLGELFAQVGAGARIARVAWGDRARDLVVYGFFPSFEANAKSVADLYAHPDWPKLAAEIDANPSSVSEGPELWRTVFGQPAPEFPVLLQREYRVERKNLKRFVELFPEAQSFHPAPVIGAIPVFSGDMARVLVVYTGKSLADVGERLDSIGLSDAFQALVTKAAEFGALTKARVLVNV